MHPAAKIQPAGLPVGIYFDLPEEDYHNDPALSHGGLAKLLSHPYDYFESSPLNPKRVNKTTKGMEFGTLSHMLLLQPERFANEYRSPFGAYEEGKIILNHKLWDQLQESMLLLETAREKYFTKGMPEVTIVWLDRETGLKMRIRIDWLRVFGGIDYKRCQSIQKAELGYYIADYTCDIQARLYSDGIKEIKRLLNHFPDAVTIQGEVDPDWLNAFKLHPESEFGFLFQRSVAPFVYKLHTFNREILDNAAIDIDGAKKVYLDSLEKWGAENWPAGDDEPEELTMFHLPRKITQRYTPTL